MIFEGGKEDWTPAERHDHRIGSVIAAVLAVAVCLWVAVARSDEVPGAATVAGEVAEDGHDAAVLCARIGGQSYSKRHRSGTVEASLHCPKGWQADHSVPISAGGADKLSNIWCQAPDALAPGAFGWKAKDRLDDWAYLQICRRGADPAAIQALFLAPADWRVSLCKYVGGAPCLP